MVLVLVAEGVFSPSSSSVHIWRILSGRVSIKEGSTMKKIAGAKGQVGGGQQGERGRNGSRTAAFGGAFVWRRRACVCGGCVCLRVHTCSSRERPKCGRAVCQVTLFHPPAPFTPASVPFLLPPARRNTCSFLGSHYIAAPPAFWVKTLQSGAIDCSYQINRVAPAAVRGPPPRAFLVPLSPNPDPHHHLPNVHPAQFHPTFPPSAREP